MHPAALTGMALALLTGAITTHAQAVDTNAPTTNGDATLASVDYAITHRYALEDDPAEAFRTTWKQVIELCDERQGFVGGYDDDTASHTANDGVYEQRLHIRLRCVLDDGLPDDDASTASLPPDVLIYDTTGTPLSSGKVYADGAARATYDATLNEVRDTCLKAHARVGSMQLTHQKNPQGTESVEGSFTCISLTSKP